MIKTLGYLQVNKNELLRIYYLNKYKNVIIVRINDEKFKKVELYTKNNVLYFYLGSCKYYLNKFTFYKINIYEAGKNNKNYLKKFL